MRRFFRVHRNEDYSQIQYLTAKCTRLSQENAVLERECVAAREGERALQAQKDGLTLQLRQKEQAILELRVEHDQLVNQVNQEKELVEILKRRVRSMAEESCKEAALLGLQLEQVGSELQLLLGSEARLEGLVETLRAQAKHREAQVKGLKAQLHSKNRELEDVQGDYSSLTQELQDMRSAHHRTVEELQHENEGSLQKLRETAEQFEWLCEQQRIWMCGFKRFKDSLSEEKESLILQVDRLQKEVTELRKSSHSSIQDPEDVDIPLYSRETPWDVDVMSGLQAEVDRWRGMYEELFSKLTPTQGEDAVNGYQKPP
ncbi:hyaluronan mediated motility receptor [Alosa sapidissima]|uniref:hyaluronan mediated motility receptor n=1 Tax=Alosa sapidissima TaxID=34773 RepID=UPI001C0A10C0|nr:hyaluronan mediated motility receptor [Alosa sapidissima]